MEMICSRNQVLPLQLESKPLASDRIETTQRPSSHLRKDEQQPTAVTKVIDVYSRSTRQAKIYFVEQRREAAESTAQNLNMPYLHVETGPG